MIDLSLKEVWLSHEEIQIMSEQETILFGIALFLIFLFAIVYLTQMFDPYMLLLSSLFVVLVTIVMSFFTPTMEEERLAEWKERVNSDYIKQLDPEHVEINSFEEIKGQFSEASFENKQEDKTVPYKLKGTEDGETLEVQLFVTIVKVKNLEKAYLEYQYLHEYIPEFRLNYNNPILYIPQ